MPFVLFAWCGFHSTAYWYNVSPTPACINYFRQQRIDLTWKPWEIQQFFCCCCCLFWSHSTRKSLAIYDAMKLFTLLLRAQTILPLIIPTWMPSICNDRCWIALELCSKVFSNLLTCALLFCIAFRHLLQTKSKWQWSKIQLIFKYLVAVVVKLFRSQKNI